MAWNYSNRKLRVCFFEENSRIVDAVGILLMQQLKQLAELDKFNISSIQDLKQQPTDLIVVAATSVPERQLTNWLAKFGEAIASNQGIRTPALIVSKASFASLKETLLQAYQANWYFDIVHPDELASLPIRVANLLRIHDHLHELVRYRQQLDDLTERVDQLTELVEKQE